jgi:hypothetical protein
VAWSRSPNLDPSQQQQQHARPVLLRESSRLAHATVAIGTLRCPYYPSMPIPKSANGTAREALPAIPTTPRKAWGTPPRTSTSLLRALKGDEEVEQNVNDEDEHRLLADVLASVLNELLWKGI